MDTLPFLDREPTRPTAIALFGHDRNDSAIRKRAAEFERHNVDVVRFMFRRERPGGPPPIDDGTIDLGATRDLDYWRRLPKLAAAVARILVRRDELRRCELLYARNLDMLAIAALARAMIGSRAPLIYESLDVRRIFIGDGPSNRVFRLIERGLLTISDALVTSSPEYMSRYYWPMQGYQGPFRILENKLSLPAKSESPARPPPLPPGPPWIIGWFGVLKCRRSLAILARVAERLGDQAEIHVRGILPEVEMPKDFVADIARRNPNILFGGSYENPADLPNIYGKVHLTWAGDFLDPEANSRWCLPNRLYEGGAMGSVMLAGLGTATGARIERDGLGWALHEPLEETVPEFLAALTPESFTEARIRVLSAPRGQFYDECDTGELLTFLGALAREKVAGSGVAAMVEPRSA